MTHLANIAAGALEAAPRILTSDFLRYALGAGGVFILVNGLFANALAGRRIRKRVLKEGQLKRELLTSLRTVFIFASIGTTIGVGTQFGVLRFYKDPAALGWAWFTASTVLAIILHDAWFYWTHRLLHRQAFFRRCHRTHHQSKTPTPFTSYAFDAEEALVHGVYLLLLGAVLPLSYLAAFIFTTHMMLRNAIGHCGYELFPARADGRPRFDFLTTVTHHDIHHADGGWNFGLYFTFWDRLMGTEHPNYHDRFAKAVRRELAVVPNRTNVTTLLTTGLISGLVLSTAFLAIAPPAHAAKTVNGPACSISAH
ncbi:MAG: sterol desaturase family protein [Pseudomonadota bacterium]